MITNDLDSALRHLLEDLASPAEATAQPTMADLLARSTVARWPAPVRQRGRIAIGTAAALLLVAVGIVIGRSIHDDPHSITPVTEIDPSPSASISGTTSTTTPTSTTATPTTGATSPDDVVATPDPVQLPRPRIPWDPAGVPTTTVAGHLLVELGRTTTSGVVVQVFDLDSGTWASAVSVPTLPVGTLDEVAPGVWTGRELIYPGASFDPVARSWTIQTGFDPDPNLQRWWSVWTGTEAVFLPGGQAYDPATDVWRVIANTPLDLRGSNPVFAGSHIYTSDGSGAWWAYSVTDDTWASVPAIDPTPLGSVLAWNYSSLVIVTPTFETTVYYRPTNLAFPLAGSPNLACDSSMRAMSVDAVIVVAGDRCGAASLVGGIWTRFEVPADLDVACLAQIDTARLFDGCHERILTIATTEAIPPVRAPTTTDPASTDVGTSADVALPPETVHRVRWNGALLTQGPALPPSVCTAVDSVQPDRCGSTDPGAPLDVDSGLATVVWQSRSPEPGQQSVVDLEADWVMPNLERQFTNAVIAPFTPGPPTSYTCPASLRTGVLTAADAFAMDDIARLTGSPPLSGTVDGATVRWSVLSIDRAGFDAVCATVSAASDVEITVALTPVADQPISQTARADLADCPGETPLAVAGAFLDAVRAGDAERYAACIASGASADASSLLRSSDWPVTVTSGNFQLDDEFERAPNLFSFGSPDLLPTSELDPNNSNTDPNGRLDIMVARQADGRFAVTALSIEFHA